MSITPARLPVELYRDIIEHLCNSNHDPHAVLYPLLVVSTSFYMETRPILYRTVVLYGWTHPLSPYSPLGRREKNGNQLMHLLATSDIHVQLIRSLILRTHFDNRRVSMDDWRLGSILRRITNLSHLTIDPSTRPRDLLNLVVQTTPHPTVQPVAEYDWPPPSFYATHFPFRLKYVQYHGEDKSRLEFLGSQPSIVDLRLGEQYLSTSISAAHRPYLPNLRTLSGCLSDQLVMHLLQRPLVRLQLLQRITSFPQGHHSELQVLSLQSSGPNQLSGLTGLTDCCPNLRFIEIDVSTPSVRVFPFFDMTLSNRTLGSICLGHCGQAEEFAHSSCLVRH